MSERGGRGFVYGAAGGLILALIVVGAASLLPSQGTQHGTTEVFTVAASASSALTPAASSNQATGGTNAGAGVGTPSVAPTSSPALTTTTIAAAEPGSAIAALPSESLGGVLSTVAPVVVGLLLAGLAYGVFLRRQDSET